MNLASLLATVVARDRERITVVRRIVIAAPDGALVEVGRVVRLHATETEQGAKNS